MPRHEPIPEPFSGNAALQATIHQLGGNAVEEWPVLYNMPSAVSIMGATWFRRQLPSAHGPPNQVVNI
jgi:hypothetical protein